MAKTWAFFPAADPGTKGSARFFGFEGWGGTAKSQQTAIPTAVKVSWWVSMIFCWKVWVSVVGRFITGDPRVLFRESWRFSNSKVHPQSGTCARTGDLRNGRNVRPLESWNIACHKYLPTIQKDHVWNWENSISFGGINHEPFQWEMICLETQAYTGPLLGNQWAYCGPFLLLDSPGEIFDDQLQQRLVIFLFRLGGFTASYTTGHWW